MANASGQPLSPSQSAAVKTLIDDLKIAGAIAALQVSPQTLAKAAAGLPLSRPMRSHIEARLATITSRAA